MKITPPIRGQDAQGAGYFGAPRGDHLHRGVDFACMKGSLVHSICEGKVTKIGYPYRADDPDKGHLRYVQVTDSGGYDHRYFYISPLVSVGDTVSEGDALGDTQGLTDIYEGITEHFHYEVKLDGRIVNPHDFLEV
jgi:murein DD-endopeptidase MepM/ murein hydrolase activator NlpD